MTRVTQQDQFITNLRNPFLKTYLQYVEQTEAPRIMHVWAALTTASACLGRHCYLDFGIGNVYPNLYTLLVGPPAAKKNTAISLATGPAAQTTKINFAPDDTAGQRQGLIAAIAGSEGKVAQRALGELSPEEQIDFLASLDVTFESPDSNTIFIEAREWGSFIGQNNLDLVRFLIKLYDGDDYKYSLRKEDITIKSMLGTMLGGTTPTDISVLLPPEVVGQGFMSRIILVFAAKKYGRFRPPRLNNQAKTVVGEIYNHLWYNCHGSIAESQGATALFDELYDYNVKIADTRFVYYNERRNTHLMKLSMILATCRKSMVIEAEDVREAHYILVETEKGMPDALGEYGLSPVAKAKQRLLEFIRYANGPVPVKLLVSMMRNDMRGYELENALQEFTQAGKLKKIETSEWGTMVVYREDRRDDIIEMFQKQQELVK